MKGSPGFYLGQPPQPPAWQQTVLDTLMAGQPVTVEGRQFDHLYGLFGLISQDPRKGERHLTIQTGYRLATLVLQE